MTPETFESPGQWSEGALPPNAVVGPHTLITGALAFKRFQTTRTPGLTLGDHCTMDGVQFAIGRDGRVSIGSYCYFTSAVLLCDLEVQIGSYVLVGWNATIADSDFHPIAAADRVLDAIACSPLGKGRARPHIERRPVIIEDDVWIGANACVLKGVRIGAGAFIEPGAMVTRDVPAGTRVGGNPAQIIGSVVA